VEYAITPAAKALKPVIDAIFTWWRNYGRAGLRSRNREEQATKIRGA
jgi:DNA-binding HxlR family transcriptional regulator